MNGHADETYPSRGAAQAQAYAHFREPTAVINGDNDLIHKPHLVACDD